MTKAVTVAVTINDGDITHVIPAAMFETILAAAEQRLAERIRRDRTKKMPQAGMALRWVLKLRGNESPMVG